MKNLTNILLAAVLIWLAIGTYFLTRDRSVAPVIYSSISVDSSRVTHVSNSTTLQAANTSTTPLPIPANVDTAAILRLFHQSHFYTQSLRDTISDVVVDIQDTVRFNMLTWRNVGIRNLRATQIITTVFDTCPPPAKPPLFRAYIGGRVGFTTTALKNVEPFIGVRIRDRWQVDYGITLPGAVNRVGVSRMVGK